MKQLVLTEAITLIDEKLIDEHYLQRAEFLSEIEKKHKIAGNTALLIASICLVTSMTILGVSFLTPKKYNLDYCYSSSANLEDYILDKNIWVYYLHGNIMKMKLVNLPCTANNVFITWKHLNNIDETIVLKKCRIITNGKESIVYSDNGESVVQYQPGDTATIEITVSKNILDSVNENEVDKLIESLRKTFTSYNKNLKLKQENITIIFE